MNSRPWIVGLIAVLFLAAACNDGQSRLDAGTELKLHGSLEIGRIRETVNVIGN